MATESLPETHRALVLKSRDEPLVVEIRPLPQLTSGSAIVRNLNVKLVSYSREVWSGKRPYPFPTPMVPGGNCVARIAVVGPDATTLKKGQLVFVHNFIAGRDNPDELCLFGFTSGFSPGSNSMFENEWRDSTLAEYSRVPLENCIPLDETRLLGSSQQGGLGYTIDDLGYLQVPLVAYGGLIDIDLKPGETIVITPATGQFGGSAVQVALAMGAGTIVAMGRNEEALKRVGSLDPTRIKTLKMTGNWETELEALKTFGPIDAFFDISPPMAKDSSHYKSCISSLRRNGRVSLMGGLGDLTVPAWAMVFGSLQLKAKWMYNRTDIVGFMRLVHGGLLKLGPSGGNEITGKFGLEQWSEAFDMAAEKARMGQMTLIIP
ncbi:MAG: hypothetical protein LQ351_004662 [Letrouitia transgressa]|nr:MAG: hypothetical protein LQ351_004662 [Letrouitia transgressa]